MVDTPAAIVAAANDALAPFGITANHTLLTPEWIVEALASSERGGAEPLAVEKAS